MAGHVHGFWPVLVAMMSNMFITVIKFIGFFISGSGAMFSEAVHSFADSMNQGLLLIGIKRSQKGATAEFSYGYGQERFFWALVSACGIFFLGAGVTIYHGIHALTETDHPEINQWVFGILAVSFVLEMSSLYVALKEIRSHDKSLSLRQALRSGDPTTIAVLYEDGVAVLGVVVAIISMALAYLTGNYWWDAIGSIIIGLLLGCVAIVLVNINRKYLIEKAMPDEVKMRLEKALTSSDLVMSVVDIKSSILNVNEYRVKCTIKISGVTLYRADTKADLSAAPMVIGMKIQRLKSDIAIAVPEIKHISIEIC